MLIEKGIFRSVLKFDKIFHDTFSTAEQLEAGIKQTFSNIFKGGDIEETKIAFKTQLQALGANKKRSDLLVRSLSALASVIVENPNEAQKTEIHQKLANTLSEALEMVKCQPGLENIDTDQDIRDDLKFAKFMNLYNRLSKEKKLLEQSPERSYDNYSNIADEYAEFTVMMIQTLKEVQAKEAASNSEIEL